MVDDSQFFDVLADAVSRDPMFDIQKLESEMEEREKSLKLVRNRIRILYESSFPDEIDSDTKEEANDIIKNLTDGRLKEWINKKLPPLLGGGDALTKKSPEEAAAELNELKALIKELTVKEKSLDVDHTKVDIAKAIKKQREDMSATEAKYQQLKESFDQLKTTLNEMAVHPSLDVPMQKNLIFENNVRKISRTVHNFNQYIDTVKRIKEICNETNTTEKYTSESHDLPPVITSLVKDVGAVLMEDAELII